MDARANKEMKNSSFLRSCTGRRAVGSHSRWGSHNDSALSVYLPNERSMSASDRKQSTLPCGFLLSSSWAALRKCWLGFNISLSKADRFGVSKYAFLIRKLQRQIGIEPTDFDLDIMSKERADFIDHEYSAGDELPKNTRLEREVDYDLMFRTLDSSVNVNLKNQEAPVPRKAIFAKYVSRLDKSCPQGNRIKVTKLTSYPESSCPMGEFETGPVTSPAIVNRKVSYSQDKTCFIAGRDQSDITESKNTVPNHNSTINTPGKYLTNEQTWPLDNAHSSRQEVEPNCQNDSDWEAYPYDPNARTKRAEEKNRNKSKKQRKSVFYKQQVDATIKRDSFCAYIGQE